MPAVSIDEINIYYEITGRGEPLLLLHGLGSSAQDWEYQLPFFSGRYTVITVDARGHGQSSKPAGPYSIKQFAADTAALIRALGLGPVHVAGLSMGGMTGYQLAVDHPELVRTLTAVNSPPEVLFKGMVGRVKLGYRAALFYLFGLKGLGGFIARRMFPHPGQDYLRQQFTERVMKNQKHAYAASASAIIGWSIRSRLGEIACPVLVIAGEYDDTPLAAQEQYVRELRDARLLVIRNSYHATPIDAPTEFNAALAEFLAQHQGGGHL